MGNHLLEELDLYIQPECQEKYQKLRHKLNNALIQGDNAQYELKEANQQLRENEQWLKNRP